MPNTPTRFPNGVSTNKRSEPLGMFGMPDPTEWHVWFDDFDNFEADQWVITRVGTTPTEVSTSADGGVLLMTMAGTDDSSSSLQWSGDDNAGVNETFKFDLGKQLFFKSRFRVSDATQSDFVIGLQITDTTPLDVSDGVFFKKDDGDANLDFHVEKNNTATDALAIHTVVANTFLTVAFYYDGVSSVKAYVNNVQVANLATTNLVDDEELTISLHMQNGEAVAKTMSVDFIFVAKER